MLKLVPLSAMYAAVSGGLGTARVTVANDATDEGSDAGDKMGAVVTVEDHNSAEEGASGDTAATSAGSYLAVVGPDLDGSPQGDR
jgi:hypothetical protein